MDKEHLGTYYIADKNGMKCFIFVLLFYTELAQVSREKCNKELHIDAILSIVCLLNIFYLLVFLLFAFVFAFGRNIFGTYENDGPMQTLVKIHEHFLTSATQSHVLTVTSVMDN